MVSKEDILKWLKEVKDPEIPNISLVDLGVITDVDISETGHVKITMTPTFAGCPAIGYMKHDVEKTLSRHGVEECDVVISYESQWNTNRITDDGRKALKKFGLTPPPRYNKQFDVDILENVPCPNCDGNNTELINSFGPTLCRSIHYCNDCKEAFEQFKPL